MLEHLENNPSVFVSIFLLILAFNGIAFFVGGKRSESRFPKINEENVVFREKGASGHSKASIFTRLGGASRVLDIVVTDKELWIKGILPMFSFIGSKYDLLHKIPLSNIKMVEYKGKAVEIKFTNEKEVESHVKLAIKNPTAFIKAVNC